jgi:hypothetical protein
MNARWTTGLAMTLVLALGLWIGSTRTSSAQPSLPANSHVRYSLTSTAEGTMLMLDTWTGDTWLLAPGGTDARNLRQWVKLLGRDVGPRRVEPQG